MSGDRLLTGTHQRRYKIKVVELKIKVPLSLLVDVKVTAIVYNWQADVFLMH